jgi:predicted anti-sigma-YlaC factor YlaD
MLSCDRCRTALLDRHYGLLDSADSAAVDAHLADCPACRAEQVRVERFGRLLSAAARSEFPDVRFIAPADVTPVSRDATRSGAGRAYRHHHFRVGWAIAAVLFIGVCV